MCGHATIALGRFLVDTHDPDVFPGRSQVPFDETSGHCKFRLRAPCGVVEVMVPSVLDEGRIRSDPNREVKFLSVPSFAAAVDLTVEIPEELAWPELLATGRYSIKVDLAYGGAFYVIVAEKELGFSNIKNGGADMKRLDDATARVKGLLGAQHQLFQGHGLDAELEYLYGVIVVDEGEGQRGLGGLDEGRIGVCFFADQQVNRSPCGSGVSARVALARSKGLLEPGERVRFDSPLSARAGGAAGAFVGSDAGTVAGRTRVLVEGRAFYTGACAFVVEDGDGFSRDGFALW